MLLGGLAATLAAPARSQGLSSRPVRLVVGASPGGSNDMAARIIAPHLGEALKTTVIVDNKPGAAGLLAYEYLTKSPADGYTLMLSSASPVAIAPQTVPKSPHSPAQDLISINTIGLMPQAIVLSPSLGVTTLKELIALARTRTISLASPGMGGLSHLTIEMLSKAAGVNFVHVPYKGGAPAVADVLAGHVHGVVSDLPPMFPYLKDRRLIAVAVTTEKRSDLVPDVPTAGDVLPGFNAFNWIAVFAPAGTPAGIVESVHGALKKISERPDVRAQLLNAGIVPTSSGSSADSRKFFAAEVARWGELAREKNIVMQ